MAITKICNEAIKWALRNISYRDFTVMLRECQHFRNIINRGGFKLNGGSFREASTVQRLASKIASDPDFARMIMLYNYRDDGKFTAVSDAYGTFDPKWLRVHWRGVMRFLRDPRPLVLGFIADAGNKELRRIGELLLNINNFWLDRPEAHNYAVINSRADNRIFLQMMSFLHGKPIPGLDQIESLLAGGQGGGVANVAQGAGATGKSAFETGEIFARMPLIHDVMTLIRSAADANAGGASPADGGAAIPEAAPSGGLIAPLASSGMGILPLTPPSAVPVASSASSVASEAVSAPPAVRPGESARIAELRREIAQMRRERREESDKLNAELKEKKRTISSLERRLAEVQDTFDGALRELAEEKDRQVDAAVNAFERTVLGINPDLQLFARQAMEKDGSLDARIRNALERQNELNQRHGSCRQLREERKRLTKYLSQIGEAIEDAVRVDPELLALQKEVDSQLQCVCEKLREDVVCEKGEYEVFPRRLLAYVKGIRLEDGDQAKSALEQVQSWVEGPMAAEVLSADEAKEVRTLVFSRRKALERHRRERLASLPIEASAGDNGSGGEEGRAASGNPGSGLFEMRTVCEFKSYANQLKEVELFIDAYNVVKRDPAWSLMEKGVNGFQEAREDFFSKVKAIAHHFKHVTIVYDSDLITDNIDHPNKFVTVVWAGKRTDGQNADNYIVDRLSSLADDDEYDDDYRRRWVVTEDYALLVRLEENECCGAHVSNVAFTALLRSN